MIILYRARALAPSAILAAPVPDPPTRLIPRLPSPSWCRGQPRKAKRPTGDPHPWGASTAKRPSGRREPTPLLGRPNTRAPQNGERLGPRFLGRLRPAAARDAHVPTPRACNSPSTSSRPRCQPERWPVRRRWVGRSRSRPGAPASPRRPERSAPKRRVLPQLPGGNETVWGRPGSAEWVLGGWSGRGCLRVTATPVCGPCRPSGDCGARCAKGPMPWGRRQLPAAPPRDPGP